jgi:hypothetical protein
MTYEPKRLPVMIPSCLFTGTTRAVGWSLSRSYKRFVSRES